MKKKAVIVGVAGQDGSYLSELLIQKKYQVLGVRRGEIDFENLRIVCDYINLHKPDEVYYLAAYHHSSEQLQYQFDQQRSLIVNHLGPSHFLEAIRLHSPKTRFFYASSSHIFAPSFEPLNEQSIRSPQNHYAQMKVATMEKCEEYRLKYGVFASVGILFNHESPRRPTHFLSQKVVMAAHEISLGKRTELVLGDLEAKVDWGYAPEYVEGMWLSLQQQVCLDYVFATGVSHSVRELVDNVFKQFGLNYTLYIKTDLSLTKSNDICRLGDAKLAHSTLNWKAKVGFNQLTQILVEFSNVN
jgi:GDPmannose 4,6-dehydratase